MPLPDDLRIAYDTFTLLATKYGFSFAGMLIGIDPPTLAVLGNCRERGHDLANLFREYAKVIDQKTDAGQIEIPVSRNVN